MCFTKREIDEHTTLIDFDQAKKINLQFSCYRDKIENFIDENKALIKRMYGSFTTPAGNRVRRAPGVPDMHDATGDSYFRHARQASNTRLPDAQAVNNTGRLVSL